MEGKVCAWIWYPGDLELYHAMKQNFSRMERGMGWPAYWKSSSFHHRIALWRVYHLTEKTDFSVKARGTGFVRVIEERPEVTAPGEQAAEAAAEDWRREEISRVAEKKENKHCFGEKISCGPGRVTVIIHVGRIEALPAAYIEGEIINSRADEILFGMKSGRPSCALTPWLADDYGKPAVPAAGSRYFTSPGQDPAVWNYAEKVLDPVRVEPVPGGTLYVWETELTARILVTAPEERLKDMVIYPGETREEALDPVHCYLRWIPERIDDHVTTAGHFSSAATPRCAVRYAFIPGPPVEVKALFQYVDFPKAASFICDDPLLNRIWEVAEHTFRLCSGIFFTDGIKRDQWIWSGDAYQSIFVNRYLLADADIERRTLTALRGEDPVSTHINTIADYSLFWILAVKEHLTSSGDIAYVRKMWPKLLSLTDFCESRIEEDGFLHGRERDWVYIDWAELDKEEPVAGEQMLMAAAWRALAEMADRLAGEVRFRQNISEEAMGPEDDGKEGSRADPSFPVREEPAPSEYLSYAARCKKKAEEMEERIREMFWSETAGAYIDSFRSGKCHISRQTNILAIRTGIADETQIQRIVECVLHNDQIPAIRTPYFQFYALDVLGSLGETEEVLKVIREYWGGMIERGAVTFWEEFDPSVTGQAQYDMYGDTFGKSLCHAWAASPIYLMARYLVGLEPGRDGSFILTPQLSHVGSLDCTLPVGMDQAEVRIRLINGILRILPKGTSGILRLGDREWGIPDGQELAVSV